MTIEKITEILVSKGVSLETAGWVETWIHHFVDEAKKSNISDSIIPELQNKLAIQREFVNSCYTPPAVNAAIVQIEEIERFILTKMNDGMINEYKKQSRHIKDNNPVPKFRIDDNIRVCDQLDTIITNIEWSMQNASWKYYFADENGKEGFEYEGAIEYRTTHWPEL